VAELENLTGGILLSLGRMSTVKIRAGSLFCTSECRKGALGEGLGEFRPRSVMVFLDSPQLGTPLHSLYTGGRSFALAGSWHQGAKSNQT